MKASTQTVTIDNKTFTFDIYDRAEMTKDEFLQVKDEAGGHGGRFAMLTSEEWEDEYSAATFEKEAAQQAGLEGKRVVVVRHE